MISLTGCDFFFLTFLFITLCSFDICVARSQADYYYSNADFVELGTHVFLCE